MFGENGVWDMIGTLKERRSALDRRYPKWEEMTIWQRFEKNALEREKEIIFIYENQCWTYGETYRRVNQVARALLSVGVGPGDHAAIWLRNCPEYVFLTFALAKIGAVKVNVNLKIKNTELAYVLRKSNAAAMFCERIPDRIVMEQNTDIRVIILVDELSAKEEQNFISWSDFLNRSGQTGQLEAERLTRKVQDPQRASDIFFTSGSTSLPKGVLVHHDMVLRSAYGTCYTRGMEEGRRLLIPIPLFHIMAYIEGMMSILMAGGSFVITSHHFSAEHVLKLMQHHQVNDIICISSMMMTILCKGCPKPEDYPSLHAGYWASVCPDEIWDRARNAFGISDVTTGYGMTECGSTAVMLNPEDDKDAVKRCNGRVKLAGSAGIPALGGALLELGVFELEGNRRLPAGETGEIRCRGNTVTHGYYQEPEKNAQVFGTDGWFKTGDLGRMDENGYLTFLGRNDDMYKINGENVSPLYIDSIIGQCGGIKEVETVGVDHPKYGAIGAVFVDADGNADGFEAVLTEYMKENLARFQIPGYLIFGDSDLWPRTGSGKMIKGKLKKMASILIRGGAVPELGTVRVVSVDRKTDCRF